MTGPWPEVDNILDLVGNLWIGLVLILAAAVPSWLAHRNNRKTLGEIKGQVVNGHASPMREDLDKAIAAIHALAHDVSGLRKDLAMEEDRRRVQIQDLATDVDRMRRRP